MGRLEVVRVGENNLGRSTSGNVFNKRGRGAYMRETFNRTIKQERLSTLQLRECDLKQISKASRIFH